MTSLEQSDRRHFFHPGTHAYDHATGALKGLIISEGRGIHLTDVEGREYIDGFSGLYCVNVGYGREEIAERMAEQCRRLSYYHTYVGSSNEPVIELSQRLIENWAPPGMVKVFYGMSGSDANETQIKLVWYYNNILGRKNRKKIIARERAYHGSGIVAGALTGLPVYHANFDCPFDRVLRTLCPDYYRDAEPGLSESDFTAHCVAELEALIEREGPAPSPRSSPSRCRAPAGSCRRPPAIGPRCKRCCAAMTSCWSPTKSCAVLAASARVLAANGSASHSIWRRSPRD
ncbi:adenosylmethionine-8-amino-7-oxononanoate aminotransferase [Paraburkholderia atlantica]|uniref:L-2,4-diaminobutyrate transaminase n=2 Tax=Paraburkholderia TaxID=1822464 RepID=A0A7W8P6Z4_9BURK|nr:L-2,4-diaminobutyrate transaminase [Paraburkholderia youngii]MBB5421239.1 L-2,4-diaminobutyrate transaminase [Paraburkholderia atlantica]MBB5429230.1 L-2,4-diaminobutyrate transaminase [Paraburkholderia atlantica]